MARADSPTTRAPSSTPRRTAGSVNRAGRNPPLNKRRVTRRRHPPSLFGRAFLGGGQACHVARHRHGLQARQLTLQSTPTSVMQAMD